MAEEEKYLCEEEVPEQLRGRVDDVTVPRRHNVVRLLCMASVLKVCQLHPARRVSRKFMGTGGGAQGGKGGGGNGFVGCQPMGVGGKGGRYLART